MKKLFIAGLKGYRKFVTPYTPRSCRYVPTCSEYAVEAFEKFGVFRGFVLSAWRVLRCNPFSKGGYDPVTTKSPHINFWWLSRSTSREKLRSKFYLDIDHQ